MAEHIRFKKKLIKMIDDSIIDHSIDCDHPACPCCSKKMGFYGHDDFGDFPYGEGYWKCDNCGYTVTENDLNAI